MPVGTPITAANIDALFRASFPARASNELSTLEYVLTEARGDNFAVVMRLIGWDVSPEDPSGKTLWIRDVKEQEIHFDPGDSNLERLQQYVTALVYVLGQALAHPEVGTLMPHDLFITDVLKLAKPRTDADFVKALSVGSRLGKYLPAT